MMHPGIPPPRVALPWFLSVCHRVTLSSNFEMSGGGVPSIQDMMMQRIMSSDMSAAQKQEALSRVSATLAAMNAGNIDPQLLNAGLQVTL
jgi:hypothetical protein